MKGGVYRMLTTEYGRKSTADSFYTRSGAIADTGKD